MTQVNELLNEAIIELRAYVAQQYRTDRIPRSLIIVQDRLLDAKDMMDNPCDVANYIEETLTNLNNDNATRGA